MPLPLCPLYLPFQTIFADGRHENTAKGVVSIAMCLSSNWSAEKPVVVEVNAMSCYPKISKAERVGRWLGRAYRGLIRQEQHLRSWLVGRGVPAPGAKVLAWSLRMLVLVSLLCMSLTLTALVAGLILIGRSVARSDLSYRTPDVEWRDGHSGFGLYTRDEFRIDPHVFDDD